MKADLLSFIQQYLGQGGLGNTPDNKGQCVGLVELWLAANGHPNIWGNAVQLLDNAPEPPYQVLRNTPDNFPSLGDIVCWDGTWGAGNGHTAVVIAANVMHLAVFEQNDPVGAGATVMTHDYSGVAGWIVLPA